MEKSTVCYALGAGMALLGAGYCIVKLLTQTESSLQNGHEHTPSNDAEDEDDFMGMVDDDC